MWPGFSSFASGNMPSKDKLSYLNFIWHNGNLEFQDENERNLVSATISKWVESPLTRYEGLVLWHVSLEKACLYLSNWGILLKASLELSASGSTRKIALKILNQMVLKFESNSNYAPSFPRFLPSLMPFLLLNLEDNEGFVLTCESLVLCITYLPEILGSFTPSIEEFLVKHLDNESTEVVEALADCFAIFPKCILHYLRPQSSHCIGWVDLYEKAVNTLHSIFEDIFLYETGSNGPRTINNQIPIFTVPCDVKGELSFLCHKVRVFSSLSRCLSKLICSESHKVIVYIEDLLELIKRIISFPEETATQARDNSVIHLIFPKMCHVAFMLLEAIVLNVSVVEHTDSILEVALKAMRNAQIISPTPGYHSKVQLSTWKFLNIWMKQCGCTVSCKIVSVKIVEELLKNIAVASAENSESCVSMLRKQTCIEALKVLNMLVESASSFFETDNVQVLISTIIKIVRQVQLQSHPLLKSLPNPYTDGKCRLELYKLLLCCCVNDLPAKKCWIVKCVSIFKLALRDSSIEVVNVGQQAQNLFMHTLNPKKPPPEHTLPIIVETARVEEPDEDIIADWEATDSQEGNWRHEQLNGQAAPMDILPAPGVYQTDGVSQESVMDNENSQERPTELDSPPHYVELGPSNHSNHYSNTRTMSRDSSLSEDLPETDSDESVSEEDVDNRPCDRVPTVYKRAPIDIPSAQRTTRPNIQTLEACSVANEADEDSSDENVTVVRDVQSDPNSMEEDITPLPSPKRLVSENGDMEESDEEEEEFCDEEEDVVPRETISYSEENGRPRKKQRLDETSPEVEVDCPAAEIGSGEENKDEKKEITEVNGQQSDNASSLKKENPTVEEMVSDFVLEEAVDS